MNESPNITLNDEQLVRLFPILAETSKEGRSLCVFLACLSHIRELAQTLLAPLGPNIGVRTKVRAYTEVRFNHDLDFPESRPDGLIIVTTGSRSWSALVEAKIGRARLDEQQIASYAKIAKANKIDALITISNEFVTQPDHHPVQLERAITKYVRLYHWSWANVSTQAKLLLRSQDSIDQNARFLLHELTRFLDHPSTGVAHFNRMMGNWKSLVGSVIAGEQLSNDSKDVIDAVASWHQETRDLALLMSDQIDTEISIKLSQLHKTDPKQRIKDDVKNLCNTAQLRIEYRIPDAAAPMLVCADFRGRTITVGMTLQAPSDRKTGRARTNWLVRQLEKCTSQNVHVQAFWPGRAKATQSTLENVRLDPEILQPTNQNLVPKQFEVRLVYDLGHRFSGPQLFVEKLEASVFEFYEQVGQRLKRWQPAAPKIRPTSSEAQTEEAKVASETETENENLVDTAK